MPDDDHTPQYWIDKLGLLPHPEGGYYKEVFRSAQKILRYGSTEIKQACTSIYYLLDGDDYSGFHRIASDEIWYFHKGSPLNIHVIDGDGILVTHELSDSETGELSVIIKAGVWFAAGITAGTGFTLASCAVAPGFEFGEFEMAKKAGMLSLYPQHTEILNKLCRI